MTWSLYLERDSKYKIMLSAHNLAVSDPGRRLSTFLALTQHCPGANCWLRPSRRGTFRSLSARPGHNNKRLNHPVTLDLQHFTIKMSTVQDLTGVMPPVSSLLILKCDKAVVCNVADMIILSAQWQIMSALPSYISLIRYRMTKKWSNQISLNNYFKSHCLKSRPCNTSPCH